VHHLPFILTCYDDDGLNLHSASNDYTHFLLTAFAKKDKIQRSKTSFKINPTHLKTHPRVLITLSNILGVLDILFHHLKRVRGPVFGGSGGGPSRDFVGEIPPLTTSYLQWRRADLGS
jgi:hypothetical protein